MMRSFSMLFSIFYSSCLLTEASWAGYIGKDLVETLSQPVVKISQEEIRLEGAQPGEDKFYPQSGIYFSSR